MFSSSKSTFTQTRCESAAFGRPTTRVGDYLPRDSFKYPYFVAKISLERENMGKNDKKSSDKSGGKAKGGDKEAGGKAKGAQLINVRHILCEKHGKKEEALAKLNEGVKFDEVARNYSEDKARAGGALGWKPKGSFDPKFEEVAFALEPSTTNNPKIGEAKTEFGYHIIMIEGRK